MAYHHMLHIGRAPVDPDKVHFATLEQFLSPFIFMQTSKVDPFAFSTPVLSATGKGTPWYWDVQTQCLSCCKQAGWSWPSHSKEDGVSCSPILLRPVSFMLIYCAGVLCLVHGHMHLTL